MRSIIAFVFLITSICFSQNKPHTVSGKIVNKTGRTPMPNCNVSVHGINRGTVSDTSGNFILYLPSGTYQLKFSHVGFKTKFLDLNVNSEGKLKNLIIEMETSSILENEVTVVGKKERATLERQKLERQDIRNMPNLYSDALRGVQILPGVTSNNELSSSYNVRGGNFDENLMYLNGFQIYRPFLLKQGAEENQTLINPAMVRNMDFYAGGFPARLGDKMSSALEISYLNEFSDSLHGSFRSDLMNLAASVNHRYKNLNYAIGTRYAYPGLFLNKLHTTGSYMPYFADIQSFFSYNFSPDTKAELLLIYANNKYKFSPYEFESNFQQADIDAEGNMGKYIRGIKINFSGVNDYNFTTRFAGLKLQKVLSDVAELSAGISAYNTKETESGNTYSDIYYTPDLEYSANPTYEYIKSRVQQSDNSIDFSSFNIQLNGKFKLADHNLDFGFIANTIKIDNRVNENSFEISAAYLTDFPYSRYIHTNMNFSSYAFYGQDEVLLGEAVRLNFGARYLVYDYTKEKLFSPRASLYFYPSGRHTINLSWGYYYQPPMYYEFRNKVSPDGSSLKSQKAIFYVLGWDYKFKEKVKFQLQTYYKDLDNLIPYYVEQLKLEYGASNNMMGYAYGVDIQFQGEITKDVQSWIGYSYLNTKEKYKTDNSTYLRRFLDQSHTIQIFLQDKFPKHPNWQSHLRIIFGSGFLYPMRKAVTDSTTGKQSITTLLDQREVFPFYMRADMGLTVNISIFNKYDLRILAEVLNVFDKQNIANYIWVQTFKEVKQPVWIPQMYSERFFNLGFELNF
ncbi:MAG: TonB-dependent receptor [Ignavibacteria bacterium]|nr:TonB-dependent receptor [Ignavibacteria bacterium]